MNNSQYLFSTNSVTSSIPTGLIELCHLILTIILTVMGKVLLPLILHIRKWKLEGLSDSSKVI